MENSNNKSVYSNAATISIIIVSGLLFIFFINTVLYSFIIAISQLITPISHYKRNILIILVSISLLYLTATTLSAMLKREILPFINTHKFWMGYLVKFCEWGVKIAGLNPDKIVRSFINLHNQFIMKSLSNKKTPQNFLLLLPHCIQLDKCDLKITSNINNCKMCGKCPVASLLKLSRECKIDIFLSTGGTLARKAIKDKKPEVILAVACERDLLSGIKDTLNLPVIGVLNERPNGPCYNTKVDVNIIRAIVTEIMNH